MNSSFRWWTSCVFLAMTRTLAAGERLVVDGYAQQQPNQPVLLSLSPIQGTVLTIPSAPADRPFAPPSRVRWEVELTGTNAAGNRTANALHTAPEDFVWPAGEEIAPDNYQGSLGGMFPSSNELDPLGVRPGSGIPDYDQDGVPDADDAFPGDPHESADTDGDGIGDNADPDDDNDGMPDAWEIANGTNPLVNDAAADLDHDGYSNYAEYEAGTQANNPSSYFHLVSVRPVLDSVEISWDALPGRTYSILHTPTLGRRTVLKSGITTSTLRVLTVTVPKTTLLDFYYLQVSLTTP